MPRIPTYLTLEHQHDFGTLTIRVTAPEPSGYTEWDVRLLGYTFDGATMMREGTTLAAAMLNLLSDLSDDCDNDATRILDYMDDGQFLTSRDLTQTLVQHGMWDVPASLFIAYGRDVVPSA
jgi:hypothetical protein